MVKVAMRGSVHEAQADELLIDLINRGLGVRFLMSAINPPRQPGDIKSAS